MFAYLKTDNTIGLCYVITGFNEEVTSGLIDAVTMQITTQSLDDATKTSTETGEGDNVSVDPDTSTIIPRRTDIPSDNTVFIIVGVVVAVLLLALLFGIIYVTRRCVIYIKYILYVSKTTHFLDESPVVRKTQPLRSVIDN